MCCCNPDLSTIEKLYRCPLWIVVLRDRRRLNQEVYTICSAIFSHRSFNLECDVAFDKADRDGSGFVDTTELQAFIPTLPCSVALSDGDTEFIINLFRTYTGKKTKLSKKDFPIFLRVVFAIVVSNAWESKMSPENIIVMNINGKGASSDMSDVEAGTDNAPVVGKKDSGIEIIAES